MNVWSVIGRDRFRHWKRGTFSVRTECGREVESVHVEAVSPEMITCNTCWELVMRYRDTGELPGSTDECEVDDD